MTYFIIGIIFGIAVPPIIDQLAGFIITFIEMFKSKMNVVIAKNSIAIRQLEVSAQEEHSFAVGFQVPTDDGQEDEEDDI